MLPQALWGMAGVTIDAVDGAITVDTDRLDPEAPLGDPALEGEPFVGLHVFLEAVRGRTAPVKAQLTGPVTLGLAISMYGVDEGLASDWRWTWCVNVHVCSWDVWPRLLPTCRLWCSSTSRRWSVLRSSGFRWPPTTSSTSSPGRSR